MQVPLILVCNSIKNSVEYHHDYSTDLAPRLDYIEIAHQLNGRLAGYNLFSTTWYRWAREIEKKVKIDFVESLFAAYNLSNHNLILSTSEKMAIPLAALFSLTKPRQPHVVIAHRLSGGRKTRLFQLWPLHQRFDHLICLSRLHADYALKQLGMPASKVTFIHHHVDQRFFHPLKVESEDYILAVGQEGRDYRTLLQATRGTGLKLVVVANSPWSTSRIELDEVGDTQVLSRIPYRELREVYAKARLVVLPLFGLDPADGITGMIEAMAMGKPLIVSRTTGVKDYVVDNETGVYVEPQNPEALRDAILSLWQQPAEQKRLGRNGRQAVEESMGLDMYVEKVVGIARKVRDEYSLRHNQ